MAALRDDGIIVGTPATPPRQTTTPGRDHRIGSIDLGRPIVLYVLAGLAEIGGGYLLCRCLREDGQWRVGLLGAVVLVAFGIRTFHRQAPFGLVYEAYGPVFLVMRLRSGLATIPFS